MKSYRARRSGRCALCGERYEQSELICRIDGGRAHPECAVRGTPVKSAKRERRYRGGSRGKAVLADGTIMSYREYLHSPAWRRTRARRIALDSGACVKCGTTQHLEVHHLTYRRLGWEKMPDLRTLCRWCHQQISDSPSEFWANRALRSAE